MPLWLRAEACPLRHLKLRNTSHNDDFDSYADLLAILSKLPLLSLSVNNMMYYVIGETGDGHVRMPTTLTSLTLSRPDAPIACFSIDDPNDPDFRMINLAALRDLRHLDLEDVHLYSSHPPVTFSFFSGLESLRLSNFHMEGPESLSLSLDPSAMPRLASLHLVEDVNVDLRRLPDSLRDLHIDLSMWSMTTENGSPYRFHGPVMGGSGQVGQADPDAPVEYRRTRAFCFDFLSPPSFSSGSASDGIGRLPRLPRLTRLVLACGVVGMEPLQSLVLPPSLRQLFFVGCGMCEPEQPFESVAGAAALAPPLAFEKPSNLVPAAAPMTAAVYGTILHRICQQLPMCTVVAMEPVVAKMSAHCWH